MPEHRGVSAAEKYAELEKAGASRPRCSCHGLEMQWHRHNGRWLCAERKHETERRWRETNPEKNRKRKLRWKVANPEKVREGNRLQGEKRRSDPEYRKWMTLYTLHYKHRKKKERYANQGLTLGDHGQENGTSRDRTAA